MTFNTTRPQAALPRITQALILASALAATGLAHAERATFTINVGDDAPILGPRFIDLHGTGSLSFSEDLLGALAVAAIQTTAVGPSTIKSTESSLVVSADVASLRGTVDTGSSSSANPADWTYTAERVKTVGGASFVTPTKRNFATTGGALSVTGITVDLTTKAVYANLTGANGVGTLNNVHVWNYTNIEGPITFGLTPYTPLNAKNTLTGLIITETGFNLFAQSLGLTQGGISALRSISEYGTIVSSISVTPVPETSTYLMMGLGLVGVAAVARKRAA